MSRADIAFWEIAMNMPITMDGVNDGMWAIILIIALVLLLLTNVNKPRKYPPNHPHNYPPNYPRYY